MNRFKITEREKRKSFWRIVSIILLVVLLLITLFTIRMMIIQTIITTPPVTFLSHPAYQKDLLLENFPIYKQVYANSCGPTTVSMVYSYLVEPISERALAEKLGISLGESGRLPDQFANELQMALAGNGYRVKHQTNIRDEMFLEQIYEQLQHNIPVPIYFSTVNAWDKPNYDTHYSVIIGIKPQERKVLVANAYGYLEEMLIEDLLEAIKYKNYQNAPSYFRLGVFLGRIDKNNIYIIEK